KRTVLHEPPAVDGLAPQEQPQFDHTSIVATILQAFASNPARAIRAMPPRVRRAPHLGSVLLDRPRTDVDEPRNARNLMELWRQQARRRREALDRVDAVGQPSQAPDGAGQPLRLTDFQ